MAALATTAVRSLLSRAAAGLPERAATRLKYGLSHRRLLSSGIRAAPGEPFGEAVRRLGVRFVLFSWTDLFGVMRSKMVPASAAEDVAADGAGFAGFAAHLDLQPSDPDVLASPDVSSLVVLPWKRDVAWVACDLSMGGKPLLQSPRDALRHAQAALKDKCGLAIMTGVELEFHLLSAEDASRMADPNDTAAKPCYQVEPLMRQYDLISELLEYMEELGWKPYQADHEDSIGQFELNWTYDDALITADRHVFYKWMVREAAARQGKVATFMPKPFSHLTGNASHMHLSLYDASGASIMEGAGHLGLSETALHFCGGMLQHAQAFTAVTNPTVNSYKRINAAPTISGSSWAPNTVSWTGNNRSHMIRVPDAPRFEMRLPDAACNAYLMPAAVIAAGMDGVLSKADPGPPLMFNLYTADAEARKVGAALLACEIVCVCVCARARARVRHTGTCAHAG